MRNASQDFASSEILTACFENKRRESKRKKFRIQLRNKNETFGSQKAIKPYKANESDHIKVWLGKEF